MLVKSLRLICVEGLVLFSRESFRFEPSLKHLLILVQAQYLFGQLPHGLDWTWTLLCPWRCRISHSLRFPATSRYMYARRVTMDAGITTVAGTS